MTYDDILEQVIIAYQQSYPGVAIDAESDFFDLGGDSLTLVSLCASLEAKVNVEIHPSTLLYHPTVEELAASIVEQLAAPA